MEIYLILAITYLVEFIKYSIGLSLCFNLKLKRIWIGMVGLPIFLLFVSYFKNTVAIAHLIMFLVIIAVLFASISAKWYQRIAYIIALLFLITSIDSLCDIPSFFLQKLHLAEIMIEYMNYLFSSFLCLLILLLVHQLRRFRQVREFLSKGMVIYSIIGIMGISVLLNIAAFNSLLSEIKNTRFYIFCRIIIALAYGAVALLGWVMIYIKKMNEKVRMNLETERRMNNIQTEYYKVLLEKEEETRRFRHDLNNHLNCLTALLDKDAIEEMGIYLNDMRGEMRAIQEKIYITGNDIIDAILNYHLTEFKETADVRVIGHCPLPIAMNDMDLCTIIANLVQNAVEAIKRSNNIKRYIHIKIGCGSNYVRFQIENNTDEVIGISENHLPFTSKEDKRNHGLGLENVRSAVENNQGTFALKNEHGRFEVIIILPLQVN